MYGDGQGYVPDLITPGAEVLVITLCPSTYEAISGRPRTGITVEQWERDYERFAGPVAKSYANVLRCRGQRGTPVPSGTRLRDAARHCRQYDQVPDGVRLIVYNGYEVAKLLAPDVPKPEGWRGFILQRGQHNQEVYHDGSGEHTDTGNTEPSGLSPL